MGFAPSTAGEKLVMQPLTPDDLLIRHQPVDDDRWYDGSAEEAPENPGIQLERHQALEHLIKDSPLTSDPYQELARIYLKKGRWPDAKRVLDLALQRFPDEEAVNYLSEEAQLARSLQLLSQAQRDYDQAPNELTKEPLDRCHVELNVLREKVCRRRLERHPDRLELNLPLASALENLGNRGEAVECLRRAVLQPRLRATAAVQLGELFERANRIPEALSAYRRAAMFRVPAPSAEIRWKALCRAADLTERNGMVDSARRYVEMMLDVPAEERATRKSGNSPQGEEGDTSDAALKRRLEELCNRDL